LNEQEVQNAETLKSLEADIQNDKENAVAETSPEPKANGDLNNNPIDSADTLNIETKEADPDEKSSSKKSNKSEVSKSGKYKIPKTSAKTKDNEKDDKQDEAELKAKSSSKSSSRKRSRERSRERSAESSESKRRTSRSSSRHRSPPSRSSSSRRDSRSRSRSRSPSYRRHTHHEDASEAYLILSVECLHPDCSKVFPFEFDMNVHMVMEHDMSQEICPCFHCNQNFPTR